MISKQALLMKWNPPTPQSNGSTHPFQRDQRNDSSLLGTLSQNCIYRGHIETSWILTPPKSRGVATLFVKSWHKLLEYITLSKVVSIARIDDANKLCRWTPPSLAKPRALQTLRCCQILRNRCQRQPPLMMFFFSMERDDHWMSHPSRSPYYCCSNRSSLPASLHIVPQMDVLLVGGWGGTIVMALPLNAPSCDSMQNATWIPRFQVVHIEQRRRLSPARLWETYLLHNAREESQGD